MKLDLLTGFEGEVVAYISLEGIRTSERTRGPHGLSKGWVVSDIILFLVRRLGVGFVGVGMHVGWMATPDTK